MHSPQVAATNLRRWAEACVEENSSFPYQYACAIGDPFESLQVRFWWHLTGEWNPIVPPPVFALVNWSEFISPKEELSLFLCFVADWIESDGLDYFTD